MPHLEASWRITRIYQWLCIEILL